MWSTNFIHMIYGIVILILACSHSANALNDEGKSTLLLYSTDLSSDNLISIQLDSITLNQIIADSEKQGRIVKKINFRDLTKLNELLNGKSTKFTFNDDAANSACEISCNANCKSVSTTTRPTITTTTKAPPRCSNGAPDSAYPDCCTNGGRGKYCCENGASNEYCCANGYSNPTCSAPTTTTKAPRCSNGAPDSAYPDCCTNGGKGQYCCTNGYNNAACSPPTTTARPLVTKKDVVTGPTYLPPVSLANKDDGITPPTTSKPITTPKAAPTTTTRLISTTTTTTRKSISTTAARDTERPTTTRISTTTTTRRPATTTLTTRRSSKSTPGPSYLPLARKSTIRVVTESPRTSYPPATWPSWSTSYTQSFPTWTGPVRRFTYEPKSTTTTARYEYKEPSNSLTYSETE